MRQIGIIETESQARVFRSYLLTLGMHSDLDQTRDKRWAVWVHEETRLDEAREELSRFLENPRDDRYQTAAKSGEQIEKTIQKDNRKLKERHIDLRTAWHKNQMLSGALTITLIFISGAVYLLQNLPGTRNFIENFLTFQSPESFMNNPGQPFVQVMNGQFWRLVTPVFLHFSILHILFNMMWMRTLGGDVEITEGTKVLAFQVLCYALAGNILQATLSHPFFGGMSGVNYGLFAYVWLVGKHTGETRYQLDQFTIGLMLFWFFACWVNWVENVANWAHTGGLVAGAISATIKLRRIPFTRIRF